MRYITWVKEGLTARNRQIQLAALGIPGLSWDLFKNLALCIQVQPHQAPAEGLYWWWLQYLILPTPEANRELFQTIMAHHREVRGVAFTEDLLVSLCFRGRFKEMAENLGAWSKVVNDFSSGSPPSTRARLVALTLEHLTDFYSRRGVERFDDAIVEDVKVFLVGPSGGDSAQVERLREENARLLRKLSEQRESNNTQLQTQVEELEKEVARLKADLAHYEGAKRAAAQPEEDPEYLDDKSFDADDITRVLLQYREDE